MHRRLKKGWLHCGNASSEQNPLPMDCTFDTWPSGPLTNLPWPLPLDCSATAEGALLPQALGHLDLDRSFSSSSSDQFSISGALDACVLSGQHATFPGMLPGLPPAGERGIILSQIQTGYRACLPRPPPQSNASPASVEVTFEGSIARQERKATKRREQNKRYQRAYRARKERYSSSLEDRIETTSTSLHELRADKRKLLQALYDLCAENDQLRRALSAIYGGHQIFNTCDQVVQSPRPINEGFTFVQDAARSSSQHGVENLHRPANTRWSF